MAIHLSLAAALAILGATQDPQEGPPPAGEPTRIDDVVVEAAPARDAAVAFIESVAAPPRGRKLAVWRDPICVGVAGLPEAAARMMADRISDWAASVDLAVGEPGCDPNIMIMATADGDALARGLVERRRRDFITGVSGSNLSREALETFQSSGAPVRWWHISRPVDEITGRPVGRAPGDPPFTPPREGIRAPRDLGGFERETLPSRIADATQDDLQQVIVVLDHAAFDAASLVQVTDYIAMAALAQVDAEAEPTYPSILGLFEAGAVQEETLTRWDRAYLQAIYSPRQGSRGVTSDVEITAAAFVRALGRDPEVEPEP